MTTILVLSILVLLHELGHFLVAKLFGIKVEEFGIGIPPKAFTLFKKGETEYSLNWLPIGGFVRLAGEDHDPSLWEQINPLLRNKMFFAKPAWQRALVVVAGVAVNFLVGMLLFSAVYTHLGIPQMTGEQVMVAEVAKGSPADLSEVKKGEVLVRVGDVAIANSDQFITLIKEKKGQAVTLYLAELDGNGNRSETSRSVNVVPREHPPAGEGALGVSVVTVPIIHYEKKPWYQAPFYAVVEGMKETMGWTREFLRIFAHPAELIKNVSGPVKVVEVGQVAAQQGWVMMARFAGIISLNLAIFNLLPIPALDGGRLVLIGLEKIVGRRRVATYERYLNGVGLVLLISLLLVVTIKDIWFS